MANITYATALNVALILVNASIAEGTNEFLVYENTKDAIHVSADDVQEKLTALKEQLGKRSSKKTPTKTQKANEGIMDTIEVALGKFENPVTVTELIAGGEGLEDLTNQKVSALLRKMIEAGRVVKTIEGKKALFALA